MVYEAPGDSYAKSTIDEFTKIVDDDKAQVLSTSVGKCEPLLTQDASGLMASEDTMCAAMERGASKDYLGQPVRLLLTCVCHGREPGFIQRDVEVTEKPRARVRIIEY